MRRILVRLFSQSAKGFCKSLERVFQSVVRLYWIGGFAAEGLRLTAYIAKPMIILFKNTKKSAGLSRLALRVSSFEPLHSRHLVCTLHYHDHNLVCFVGSVIVDPNIELI